MDNFATLPNQKRKEIFVEVKERRGLQDIIVEKDFWVCWTLKRLFTHPELAPFFIFKGGTSLSKAYNLIERFSEDIDLTIARATPALSAVKDATEHDISGKERKRRLVALKTAAQDYIRESVYPLLQEIIAKELGNSEEWELILDEQDPDLQTILFYYPKVFDYDSDFPLTFPHEFGSESYIRPHIKLEFGARGDIVPNEPRPILPYTAETLPDLFENPESLVSALSAERTFWEKTTILHGQYHGTKMRERMSRHYYDTYMLIVKGVGDAALKNPELLEHVVNNKTLMLRDPKASHDTAKLGSLRLIPSQERISELENDYQMMASMIFGDIPSFQEIIETLAEFENKVNA